MIPTDRFSGLRRALTVLVAIAAAAGLPACVYRPNIQQGNLLQLGDLEQIKPGMTRSQVRYILGTPMVSDPFEAQRWDYVYTFQQGRSKEIDRSHFVVYFDGDKVSRVERLDLPEETETQKIIRTQREAAGKAVNAPSATPPAAAAPPAPSSGAMPQTPPPAPQPPGGG
jgi:outer membrane protein assembly factor BamE